MRPRFGCRSVGCDRPFVANELMQALYQIRSRIPCEGRNRCSGRQFDHGNLNRNRIRVRSALKIADEMKKFRPQEEDPQLPLRQEK
jgi:hypothetical protein